MLHALLATLEVLSQPFRYLNSRAFHHVTPDVNNLSISTPYVGNDQLVVGNGKRLNITKVGSSNFLSQTHFKRELILKNVLYVPGITKNLLSMAHSVRITIFSLNFIQLFVL